jgi:hypothetical protein
MESTKKIDLFLEKENSTSQQKEKFSICEFFTAWIALLVCPSRKKSSKINNLKQKIEAFRKLKDYDYFLEKSIEVDLLKRNAFNSNQIALLGYVKLCNYCDLTQFSKSNKKRDKMSQACLYLADLIKSEKPKSDEDKIILDVLGLN